MENRSRNNDLIAQSYVEYYQDVLNYISARVNDIFDAENIAQDVWLRLLEYDKQLAAESLRPFIYTVARNLVNDYLRHIYISRALSKVPTSVWRKVLPTITRSRLSWPVISRYLRRSASRLFRSGAVLYMC